MEFVYFSLSLAVRLLKTQITHKAPGMPKKRYVEHYLGTRSTITQYFLGFVPPVDLEEATSQLKIPC